MKIVRKKELNDFSATVVPGLEFLDAVERFQNNLQPKLCPQTVKKTKKWMKFFLSLASTQSYPNAKVIFNRLDKVLETHEKS